MMYIQSFKQGEHHMSSNVNGTMAEALPALVDPPHPVTNPCSGCPRWQRKTDLIITESAVYWRNVSIGATMGELRIITTLVAARGEYVEYRTIYDKLKGIPGFRAGYGDDGFHTNVRSCIKRIRKKFIRLDPEFNCIVNMQAYGYAWKDSK